MFTILIIGDSLSTPWPTIENDMSWPQRIQFMRPNDLIINVAQGGTFTFQWAPGGTYYNHFVKPVLATESIDCVVILLGSNDALFSEVSEWRNYMGLMISHFLGIKKIPQLTVMVQPPTLDEDRELRLPEYRDYIRSLDTEFSYLNVIDLTKVIGTRHLRDQVHLDNLGHLVTALYSSKRICR